jgi:glycosyltransferase involved in cell wall biosynthesis
MPPTVSICIPAYRQASVLKVLLDTIDAQTYRDFEVVISDDSPDHEVQQLCLHYTGFPIRYFRNSPSKGSPANWNHAISLAEGAWVKLMHHDDYFSGPDSLQHFMDAVQQDGGQADYYFCKSWINDKIQNTLSKYQVDDAILALIKNQPALLFMGNLIGAPSAGLFRKGIDIQYDASLIWLVDIEFYIRLLKQFKVKHIPEFLVTTVNSTTQLTNSLRDNKDVEIREFLFCLTRHYPSFDALNRRMMRMRLWNLLEQFNITAVSELRQTGFKDKLPGVVTGMVKFRKANRRLANSFYYRINKFSPLKQ